MNSHFQVPPVSEFPQAPVQKPEAESKKPMYTGDTSLSVVRPWKPAWPTSDSAETAGGAQWRVDRFLQITWGCLSS